MAQQVKFLVWNLDSLGSTSRTNIGVEKRNDSTKLSSNLYVWAMIHTPYYPNTIKIKIFSGPGDLNRNSNLPYRKHLKSILMSSLQYTVGYNNTCDFILWALDPSMSQKNWQDWRSLQDSHRACMSRTHQRCLGYYFLIDFWSSRVGVCGFGKVKPPIKWRMLICFGNSESKDIKMTHLKKKTW